MLCDITLLNCQHNFQRLLYEKKHPSLRKVCFQQVIIFKQLGYFLRHVSIRVNLEITASSLWQSYVISI